MYESRKAHQSFVLQINSPPNRFYNKVLQVLVMWFIVHGSGGQLYYQNDGLDTELTLAGKVLNSGRKT